MKKLIELQSELKCGKSQFNKFGKYYYRSQEDVLEALKPLLLKHGLLLTITDEVREVAGMAFVEAIARVEDATKRSEFVESRGQAGIEKGAGMSLAQSFGSSSSYARKYALNGLFLIDDTKDADATNDHGKPSQAVTPIKKATPKAKPAPIVPMGERIKVEYGDKVFLAIVKAVAEGTGTIEQAKGKYNIPQIVEDKIKEKVQALAPILD